MPHTMLVNNRPVAIHCDKDFEEVLEQCIGSDAVLYFRDAVGDPVHLLKGRDWSEMCPGECDRTYALQEAYAASIGDLIDDLEAIYSDHLGLKRPHNLAAIANVLKKARSILNEIS